MKKVISEVTYELFREEKIGNNRFVKSFDSITEAIFYIDEYCRDNKGDISTKHTILRHSECDEIVFTTHGKKNAKGKATKNAKPKKNNKAD